MMKLLTITFILFFSTTLLNAKEYIPCFINGNLYANNGDYKKALEWYEKGIDSNVTDCIINAASIYMNEEKDAPYKPEHAASLLKKALLLEPYDSFIHYNLGVYYYNLGVGQTNEQRESNDLKAKYHFLFAHLLGDKDSASYVKGYYKLIRKYGFLDDVVKKTTFNIELIAKRLEKFSQGKVTFTSKYKDLSIVLNTKYFKVVLKKDEIKFYGRLDVITAKNFGKHIKTIQDTLYIDVPHQVTSKTETVLIKMMYDVSSKMMLEEEFSDSLVHNFTLMNRSKVFIYKVSFVK